MEDSEQPNEFESVKARLAEIAEAVSDEEMPLDDALDLYEEAVALGLRASDLLETGIAAPEEEPEGEPDAQVGPEAQSEASDAAVDQA